MCVCVCEPSVFACLPSPRSFFKYIYIYTDISLHTIEKPYIYERCKICTRIFYYAKGPAIQHGGSLRYFSRFRGLWSTIFLLLFLFTGSTFYETIMQLEASGLCHDSSVYVCLSKDLVVHLSTQFVKAINNVVYSQVNNISLFC